MMGDAVAEGSGIRTNREIPIRVLRPDNRLLPIDELEMTRM